MVIYSGGLIPQYPVENFEKSEGKVYGHRQQYSRPLPGVDANGWYRWVKAEDQPPRHDQSDPFNWTKKYYGVELGGILSFDQYKFTPSLKSLKKTKIAEDAIKTAEGLVEQAKQAGQKAKEIVKNSTRVLKTKRKHQRKQTLFTRLSNRMKASIAALRSKERRVNKRMKIGVITALLIGLRLML